MTNGDSGDKNTAGKDDGAFTKAVIVATLAALFVAALCLHNEWNASAPFFFLVVVGGVALVYGCKAEIRGASRAVSKWAQDSAVILAIVAAVVVEGVLVYLFWPIKAGGNEHLRNFILATAAVIGFPFLVWRGRSLDRQSKATHQQADAAQKQAKAVLEQADTDSRRRLTSDYAKFAEMFASDLLSERLAGLYGLWDLARDSPEIYHIRIMEVLCAFIRQPTTLKDWGDNQNEVPAQRPDVSAAITLIRERGEEQIRQEKKERYGLNFTRADLRWSDFRGAHLNAANFIGANLSGAQFMCADIRKGIFMGAKLSEYDATSPEFSISRVVSGADFRLADLRGALFVDIANWTHKMNRAAVNGAEFAGPRGADGVHEQRYNAPIAFVVIAKGVILKDESGAPLGFDAVFPGESSEIRSMIIRVWQKEREEWRRLQGLPATRH